MAGRPLTVQKAPDFPLVLLDDDEAQWELDDHHTVLNDHEVEFHLHQYVHHNHRDNNNNHHRPGGLR
jgi:hypothetical protein